MDIDRTFPSHHGVSSEIILSFFDTLIYGRDLDLLTGKHWINDVLIGFYNEYLEKFVYCDHRSKLCLVHPDVVFACASGTADFAAEITKDLDLSTKNFVFLPVNDNRNSNSVGGTHWSLLIYNRLSNQFLHLDSAAGHNSTEADHLSKVLWKALQIDIISKPASFEQLDAPQQSNGYDCGMYVMSFSDLLCSSLIKQTPLDLQSVTPQSVIDKRKQVYDLILHLREIG